MDGHREKTLALLWQIIFHFQVRYDHADFLNIPWYNGEYCARQKKKKKFRISFRYTASLPFQRNLYIVLKPWLSCRLMTKRSQDLSANFFTDYTTSFTNLLQVNVLLSEKLLKEEIAHLESTRILRVQLTAADNWTDEDKTDFAGNRRDSSDLYFQSDRLRLLFKWCKTVCRVYDLKVRTRIHLKKNHWISRT